MFGWRNWFRKPEQKTVRGLFSQEDLGRIKLAVAKAEEKTSAEIRVMLRDDLDGETSDINEQARRDFLSHGMTDTRDRTGVLILVVFSARQVAIWAGDGIYQKLPQRYWNHHAEELAYHFGQGNYTGAITFFVEDIGGHLSQFFPKKPDDVNELLDDVIVEGVR